MRAYPQLATVEGRALALRRDPGLVEEIRAAWGERCLATLLGTADRCSLPPARTPDADAVLDRALLVLRLGTGAALSRTAEGLHSPAGVAGPVDQDSVGRLLTGAVPAGRRRGGPPPVAILSTAGDPDMVAEGLGTYVRTFAAMGYRDLEVLVVDDAPAAVSDRVDGVIARAGEDSGVAVTRFGEHDATGAAGPKALLRAALVREVARRGGDAAEADRILRPGAVGSANLAFWVTDGSPRVWLEQDAAPFAAHGPGPETATGWREDGSTPPAGRVDVDVPHIIDRLLYGPAETPTTTEPEPDWEGVGWREGPVADGVVVEPWRCHFRTVGHADYRAAFLHNLVTLADLSQPVRDRLLAGDLDRWRWCVRPPVSTRTPEDLSVFGTAVGFRHDIPLPMMAATRIRLFDYSVGLLLRAAGYGASVTAGTALWHLRAGATASGRGSLASYLRTEQWLFVLYHAMESLLAEFTRRPGEDVVGWLERAGRGVEARAADWTLSLTDASRRYADTLVDAVLRAGPHGAAVGAHLADVLGDRPRGFVTLWQSGNDEIRAELRAYGRQLRVWSVLTQMRHEPSPELLRHLEGIAPLRSESRARE